MTRQRRRQELSQERLKRHYRRGRAPRDRQPRRQILCHVRQELRDPNPAPSPSISLRSSFYSNEGHESCRTWQRSSSPAPRRLGDTTFQYRDLGENEIRLLRIFPAATSILKCELFHISQERPCPYIAISYAWGDADDTRTIMLDGHEFVVTDSLMLALQRLRSRSSSVIVWADAICINQQDIEERNLQVQAMTSIYQKAAEVAIWLGPEAGNSNLALQLLHKLHNSRTSAGRIRAIIESPDLRASFRALVALFDRDYWGRRWVVQEVLNGRRVIVYCGASQLPWATCLSASDILERYNSHLVKAFLYVEGRAAISASGNMYAGQLSCGGPRVLLDLRKERSSGLLDVLLYHQEKSCSEPRDRLYSLLGILSLQERLNFPVDYNRPVRHVYIDVVDYLLTTTRRFDVICASIHFPERPNIDALPSWCPDWSERRRTKPIGHIFRFSAAGTTHVEFDFSNWRRTLNISAIFMDKIYSTGIPLNPPIGKGALIKTFEEWRLTLIAAKGYNQADHEAFCRTLSCGQVPDTWTPREWLEWTYRIFANLLLGRYPASILDHHLMSYASNFTSLTSALRKQILSDNYKNLMAGSYVEAMTGRCFAITASGLLCLGSRAHQIEDIICIPLGSSTPIILRKRGEGYTYIGDIYVDGYMDGKAIEELEHGTRELRRFALN
ncbi:hypothetical protein ACEPPN_019097 [Leptodophora sp. 'Broadleaf-Isolate-01']